MRDAAVLIAGTGAINFFRSKYAWLPQQAPNNTPRIFADKILVPDSGIAMDRCAWSKDGREFYYVNTQSWFDASCSRVRVMRFDGKAWQGPFTIAQGYYAPTFSIDENTLFLAGGPRDPLHAVVSAMHREGKRWSAPAPAIKASFGLYDYMPTRSGMAYVGSNARQGFRGKFATYDFCKLRINGRYADPKPGPAINTPGFDGDFYIAPDESYMIVSYQEKPDYECKLGISFRRRDGSWPVLLDLGTLINAGDAHHWGQYVSPDGHYLFYTMGTSEKECHIYWVRFDHLEKRLQKMQQSL